VDVGRGVEQLVRLLLDADDTGRSARHVSAGRRRFTGARLL
jgi:hypothetical protein